MVEFALETDLDVQMPQIGRFLSGLVSGRVAVEFLKEHLAFTDEDSAMSNLLLSIMCAFAEFERSIIKERQLEGMHPAGCETRVEGFARHGPQSELRTRVGAGGHGALAHEFDISLY